MSGIIAAADGFAVIRGRVTGPAGDPLGRQLACMLLQHGGAALLDRASYQGQSSDRVVRVFVAQSLGRTAHSIGAIIQLVSFHY